MCARHVCEAKLVRLPATLFFSLPSSRLLVLAQSRFASPSGRTPQATRMWADTVCKDRHEQNPVTSKNEIVPKNRTATACVGMNVRGYRLAPESGSRRSGMNSHVHRYTFHGQSRGTSTINSLQLCFIVCNDRPACLSSQGGYTPVAWLQVGCRGFGLTEAHA